MARLKKRLARRPQRFDIVIVEWVDTEQDYNWTDFATFESADPPTMRSVGFLYEDLRSRVTIFQSIDKKVLHGGIGMFDSTLTIPKRQVISVTVIRKSKSTLKHEPSYSRK